ncbi:amino acid adenylation domain-containing protein [Streptomyces tendae]|uniref:amino acid adenylation domain-containing protein n=1 Tax=Streptomyces tendae TaxID=1932 RepID=UPI0024931F4E|nr:amino acid adenylation domain-containing protein [Streptomyces tendae]
MIAERFRVQAATTPDALAIADGGVRLSYAELAYEAETFARGLARLGVRPGQSVGLAGYRSVHSVVAVVGTVLAQAAYVPISPSSPARRLRQILAKSEPRLIVCGPGALASLAGALPDRAPVVGSAKVLAVGAGGTPDATDGGADAGAGALAPAYVMFTSGSTGEPKGVVVEQRGVVRLVCEPDHVWLRPGARMAHAAALEFDASTLEIWGALLNGGSLHVADVETVTRPARYAAFLRRERVGFAWLTAPLFHRMTDHDPAMFRGLRTLMTGGDVVSAAHAARVLAANPELELYNGYGPTENTVFTTVHRITAPVPETVPIGSAVRGTELHVCDENGRPVRDGTEGELWVSGSGVARGYLNDPVLTEARFPGGRYRTGDRVSRDPDGLLHFHGRFDHQTKIMGNLVEPAEVTAALVSLPAVRRAHTVALRDAAGEARLYAYAVTEGTGPETGPDALRATLAGLLPTYLRPALVMAVDELPLNANGKVDTTALPDPLASAADARPADAAAVDGVTGAWCAALGFTPDSLPPDGNFFDLGGDSVRLAAVLDHIDRCTGRRLSFRQAYAAATVSGMRALLDEAERSDLPIPRGTGTTGPTHPSQRGLYALWQADPESLAYNIPVRVDLEGDVDRDRLSTALQALVNRHDALRTRFTADVGGVTQEVLGEVRAVLEDGAGQEGFVRPFDLGVPPLLRGRLVGRRLYLDLHHIVVDGESVRVLVQELLELHEGLRQEPPRTRWLDAARWCDEHAAADLAHWLSRLEGAPRAGALVTDRPRPPRPGRAGGRVHRDPVAAGPVEKAARAHGTTPFVVLLAAYATTLARTGGLTDLVIGTPMRARPHPDLAEVVGMFVTTVPLRVRVPDGTTVSELIADLHRGHQEALDHQSAPFDRLVRGLGVRRPEARAPLFDAFFALQNLDSYAFAAGGLKGTLDFLHPGTARFDLNLQVHARPDRMTFDLEYATELYEASTADHLLNTVLQTLDEIIREPESRILRRPRACNHVNDADFDFGAVR